MRTRRLPYTGLLASFAVILFLLSSLPGAYATPPVPGQTGVTVTGRVVINGVPIPDEYVWIAPKDTSGNLDYQNARATWTDPNGIFAFDDMAMGDYSLNIEPDCAPDGQPLRDYPVQVLTATVNLGDIALPAAPMHIVGSVTRASSPVDGAPVVAFNIDNGSYRCALTDSTGQYRLGVDRGNWEISVDPVPGALWMFTQTPPIVRFASSTAPQTSTVNLVVQPTDGFLIGLVLTPAGTPLLSPYAGTNYAAYIDVWNNENRSYTFGYLNNNGTFSVPVVAGHYQVVIGLDETFYPNFASPSDLLVEVGAQTINLRQIQLLQRSSVISGTVQSSSGVPIPNAIVEAYQSGGNIYYDQTDAAGRYSLRVTAGNWHVRAVPPPGTAYLDDSADEIISIANNVTKTLTLVLQPAAAQIQGTLVNQQGTLLTDVEAWAYARKDGTQEYVAIEPVSYGYFALNVPAGKLRVGVFLPPGSQYSLVAEPSSPALAGQLQFDQSLSTSALAELEQAPYEQLVSVPSTSAAPAQTIRTVQVQLAQNNAHIRGTLRDQAGKPVTGVSGVVGASPAAANSTWQWAYLNPSNGTFDLLLTAGTWYLSYDLDGDQYVRNPAQPIQVQVGAGQTVTKDLSTTVLDGVLRGQVVDDKQQPLPSTYVWVRGTNFEQFALTDVNGRFAINVPLRDGNSLARYTIGTLLSCAVDKPCLLDVDPQTVTAAPRSLLGLGASPAQSSVVLKAKGSAQSESVTVSGQIFKGSNQPVAGASVTFTPNSGRKGTGYTDNGGNYSLSATVTRGLARVRYTQTAGYVEGSNYYTIDKRDQISIEGRLQQLIEPGAAGIPDLNLLLQQVAVLPKTETQVFNVVDGWSHTLSDGTQIQIPANAVPTSEGETQVRVVLEPALFLEPSPLYDPAIYYGYTITLFQAQSGKQIIQPLKTDALLTLRYDEKTLADHLANEGVIRPASFAAGLWQPASRFVVNGASNKVTIQTRTLGTWALVRPHITDVLHFPLIRR